MSKNQGSKQLKNPDIRESHWRLQRLENEQLRLLKLQTETLVSFEMAKTD